MSRQSAPRLFLAALLCLSAPTHAQAPIVSAPAFTSEQLRAAPRADWITNGGSLELYARRMQDLASYIRQELTAR